MLHAYFLQHKLLLQKDHDILQTLFSEFKAVPTCTSNRIQRLVAVALHTRRNIHPRGMVLMVEGLQDAPITAIQITQWTRCDPLVARVTRCILEGWPNSLDEEVQPCWMRCLELSIHDWWIV